MKSITIPCSFDNYSYLFVCEISGMAAVIDPTESYPVISAMERLQVKPEAVLCTHHHQDHIGGVEDLLNEYGKMKVVCHSSDRNRIPLANHYVQDGDSIRIGESEGRVLHTPGHTTGSICYLFGKDLFCGDTLFGAGCGRLFEGSPEQMHRSLTEKLVCLPEDTRVFFGHEYTRTNLQFALTVDPQNQDVHRRLSALENMSTSTPSTLMLERSTNPFLRADNPRIWQCLRENHASAVKDEVEAFTVLRQLRNHFS